MVQDELSASFRIIWASRVKKGVASSYNLCIYRQTAKKRTFGGGGLLTLGGGLLTQSGGLLIFDVWHHNSANPSSVSF